MAKCPQVIGKFAMISGAVISDGLRYVVLDDGKADVCWSIRGPACRQPADGVDLPHLVRWSGWGKARDEG